MQHTLEILIELQDVDLELMQLKRLRGNLPQQVAQLEKELQALEEKLADNKSAHDEALKGRLGCEGTVTSDTEKLTKFREQIYSVKTNKEYDALTLEIETKEQEINEAETRILELLDLEEKLKQESAELQSQIDALNGDLADKRSDLNSRLEQTEAREETLKESRKKLVGELSRPILSAYERVRKGKGGQAVASIENGTCTGCSSSLPPQTGQEIRKKNQIINCQTCGRFLIWQENGQQPKAETVESNPEQVG